MGCSSDGESSPTSTEPSNSLPPRATQPSVATTDAGPPTASDFDRTLPTGDEPEGLGPIGATEAEFETDDGLVQIGAAEVPELVAASFPLPDDLEVQISSQVGAAAGFSGVSELSFVDLVEFYEVEFPAAGYEAQRSQFVDGVVAVIEFAGPDGSGEVAISSAPGGGRSVLVTFS
jgi:hypothetical protein